MHCDSVFGCQVLTRYRSGCVALGFGSSLLRGSQVPLIMQASLQTMLKISQAVWHNLSTHPDAHTGGGH